MESERRVVVTGMGVLAPKCGSAESFWSRLLSGEPAIGPLETVAGPGMKHRLGGEVESIDRESLGIARKELRYLDVVSTYGLLAAREALRGAGLDAEDAMEREEIGFAVGLFSGPLSLGRHESHVNLFSAAMSAYYGSVIGNITIPLRICGPAFTHLNLDLAGSDAIGYGFELVRHGKARAVLAGGSDSAYNVYMLAQLREAGILHNGSGPGPSGEAADDMVLGEGAAFLVLESLESAEGRGRPIHAEILGYSGGGGSAAGALEVALSRAGVAPEVVDCVVATASGLPDLDRREDEALREVLGDAAAGGATTNVTWAVGNTLGAAGALRAATAALILKEQRIPPAGAAGPAPGEVREAPAPVSPIDVVLQTGFGLSGRTSSLVLARYEGSAAHG